MANALHPTVRGHIGVTISNEALVRKTRQERNEYLIALRYKIQSVLEEARLSNDNIISAWYIDLYEYDEDEKQEEK